jgi:hypothetical protein
MIVRGSRVAQILIVWGFPLFDLRQNRRRNGIEGFPDIVRARSESSGERNLLGGRSLRVVVSYSCRVYLHNTNPGVGRFTLPAETAV